MKSPKTIAKAITLGLIASAAMTNCGEVFIEPGKKVAETVASPGFWQKVGSGLSSAKNSVFDMDNVYAVGRGFETAANGVATGFVTTKDFVFNGDNWKVCWNALNMENGKAVLKNKYTWIGLAGVAGLVAAYKTGLLGKLWSKVPGLRWPSFFKRKGCDLEDENQKRVVVQLIDTDGCLTSVEKGTRRYKRLKRNEKIRKQHGLV